MQPEDAVDAGSALDEATGTFLAIAGHELRTPITVIQGYAGTLLNRWDQLSDDDRREAVEVIAARTAALAALVEQLLRAAAAGAPGGALTLSATDLRQVLGEATLGFDVLSDRHRLELVVPAGFPPVRADAAAVAGVVIQLLENALKYSPDGGKIAVRAVRQGSFAVVAVEDEGIGIPAGEADRLFERFYQDDAGDRRRFGGVGLGLWIVRALVEAQGGTVAAAPRPGGGSRVEFTLPLAPDQPGRPAQPEPSRRRDRP